MSKIKNIFGLDNVGKIYRNMDNNILREHAIRNENAKLSSADALIIDTGIFTGRSPKDKFFVNQDS